MNICVFDLCNDQAKKKNLCKYHYNQKAKGYGLSVRWRWPEGQEDCDFDGCDREHRSRGLCAAHYAQQKKGQDLKPLRQVARRGEGSTNEHGYRMVSIGGGKRVLEHRHIMAQFLGRELLPEETVHHRNGNRTDNRISNLELWTSRHPKGQRVSEQIAWAKDILALYADVDCDIL